MTRKKNCQFKVKQFRSSGGISMSSLLRAVLQHRHRRGRRNIAWHLSSCNRKGTISDSWPTTGQNVKLFSGGGPEPASVRHVGDTCEWRRQVRWCRTMQRVCIVRCMLWPDACLWGRSSRVVSASDCGVRGPTFEPHRGRLCLSRQPLRYAPLGTGCGLVLQYLGQSSLAFLRDR